jgi:hypothetical protein
MITYRNIPVTALFLFMLFSGQPLFAQSLLKIKTPGAAFLPEGRAVDVMVDDVAGGRRFRGKAFASVMLRAKLRLPATASAVPKVQRLVVRFRTSASGPSLRTVELRNGANVSFRIETNLAGNYVAREATEPESIANAWFWREPVSVGAASVIRLKIIFPGGFDSQINPGEFVLHSVEAAYPLRISGVGTRIRNTPLIGH